MNWLNSLELKFGRFAIPGLIRIVVMFNALTFLAYQLNNQFLQYLVLDPELVRQGQVWRLVTYIFIPSIGGSWIMPDYLWLGFALLFLWMLGDGLEHEWGAFKLNCYYLIGMIGTTIAAFFFGMSFNNWALNLSLLFAFATIYPDFVINLFLVIPIRIKWLAWFSFAMLMLAFLGGSTASRMAILASLANYLVFFGADIIRMAKHRNEVTVRRRRFESAQMPEDEAIHHCHVCKRTELTSPDLDFRVSADGFEYCTEHLPGKNPAT